MPPIEPQLSPGSQTTGEPSLDRDLFRRGMGRFATGVAVMSTVTGEIDHAMTINSLTSVSLDPMLVLVCVELDARFHDAVLDAGRWGVSILAAEDRGVSTWFATRGRPLHDQFGTVAHHRGEPTGVVLLDHALTTLQCVTTAVYPGGDHSIVVGEVVAMSVPPQTAAALLYYRGGYHQID